MKIKKPEPFTFEAGPRAVLLLHGFTGHSADVRMLGRFLEKKGYTSHAPIYRGHGLSPEELIESTPNEWWEDVQSAYEDLINLGYKEIAVVGLSLGGALGLKLAYSNEVKAIIPMSTPMFFDNEVQLMKGFKLFARQYKQLERKDDATIEKEIQNLVSVSGNLFNQIGEAINHVRKSIDTIYSPAMVIQPRLDQMININSATYIYDHVQAEHKKIKWYEKSGHAITLGKERDQLHEDIYDFLQSLQWKQ